MTHCWVFFGAQSIHSCHSLPEKEHNTRLDATSWAHGAEWQQEQPFDQNCEMELGKANNETIPLRPNQLGKKGALYQGQAAVEATLWQNGLHECYVKRYRVGRFRKLCLKRTFAFFFNLRLFYIATIPRINAVNVGVLQHMFVIVSCPIFLQLLFANAQSRWLLLKWWPRAFSSILCKHSHCELGQNKSQ